MTQKLRLVTEDIVPAEKVARSVNFYLFDMEGFCEDCDRFGEIQYKNDAWLCPDCIIHLRTERM